MVTELKVESVDVEDDYEDTFTSSSTATVSENYAVAYWSEDEETLSSSDKSSILGTLGVNAVHNQEVEGKVKTDFDDQGQKRDAVPLLVQYIGGANVNDGTEEETRAMQDLYFMKGYMLRLTAPGGINDGPYNWSITKGGQAVGTFYADGDWATYDNPLQAAPQDKTVYWRSDRAGADADTYTISVTYTVAATGKARTVTWKIHTRLLTPTNPKMANVFNDDADMAQRAMIQVFGMNKGKLTQYRIGQYDTGAANGWYVSDRLPPKVTLWSAIADEVENFDQFALGTAAGQKSNTLRLATIQGIWSEFDKILAVPLPQAVNGTHAQFNNWITAAGNNGPLAAAMPGGATVTADQTLAALIEHESKTIHSYAPHAPLAVNSIQVGENTAGAGANLHVYTDFGLGFAKVQPYNHNGLNLYDPAQNILRGAQMFASFISNAANQEVGNNKLWIAYYRYNSGGYGGGTVAAARAASATYAARCDAFFTALGLPLP